MEVNDWEIKYNFTELRRMANVINRQRSRLRVEKAKPYPDAQVIKQLEKSIWNLRLTLKDAGIHSH